MDIPTRIAETRLRIDRENRLAWNENQIRTSMNNIASSLRDIHQNKLWEGKFTTFEEYCQETWGMTRQRAYQLLGAENTRLMLADEAGADEALKSVASRLNHGQAAELEHLPPKKAIEVLKEAVSRPGKMTAAKIKAAKARVIESNPNITTASALITAEVTESEAIEQARGDCPACRGTGERDTSISGPSNFVTCSNCQGSGKASRIGVCPHCGGAI